MMEGSTIPNLCSDLPVCAPTHENRDTDCACPGCQKKRGPQAVQGFLKAVREEEDSFEGDQQSHKARAPLSKTFQNLSERSRGDGK